MKKEYLRPSIEVQVYTLNASIAANCANVINVGPGDNVISRPMCSDFEDSWEVNAMTGASSIMSASLSSFYESGTRCDCYYSAGNEGYFTS